MHKFLDDLKMIRDDDTSYDEVARDAGYIGVKYIKDKKVVELFVQKINQLMRLLNDSPIFEGEKIEYINRDKEDEE
jgi:hypothetical protein